MDGKRISIMRAHEILKEARENPVTIYDNGRGETMHVEDRGPKYHLMGTDSRYYGWTDKYDMAWNSEEEMNAWLDQNGFDFVGVENVEEGDVLPFQPRDDRTDQEKYDDAASDQKAKNWVYDPEEDKEEIRSDIGQIPCPYCEKVWCNI